MVMDQSRPSNDELMEKLKKILLKEDREELDKLKALINSREQLSEKVAPIIEERLDFLRQNFPEEYKGVINKIIEEKLKSSQAQIIDAIYPAMGKMIKKYINHQFVQFKESVDNKVKNSFSVKGFMQRMRSKFGGVDETEVWMRELSKASKDEVFVIQRDSGLLIGHASLKESDDKEVVAGMFTAIKSFVEDAFKKGQEDLGSIDGNTYTIQIENFKTFYIAIVMSGKLTIAEKEVLSNDILTFADEELSFVSSDITEDSFDMISNKLKAYFFNQKEVLKT